MKIGGLNALELALPFSGEFFCYWETENTEPPFKKPLCLQQVTAVAVLTQSQGSYRCDITRNWGLAIGFTANIP